MNAVTVIGGVYGEVCAFPEWNQVFGSGGRAAAALSTYFDKITLHSILPKSAQKRAVPNLAAFNVDPVFHEGQDFITFEYMHCLDEPKITPRRQSIEKQPTFTVKADLAILFGMMECTPAVDAKICVYDPQSSSDPLSFRQTGSTADRLAIVANAREITLLTGLEVEAGARQLVANEQAEIVVAKCGMDGAKLFDASGFIGSVPAYQTRKIFTIGSGDVFVAAFALAWGKCGIPPQQAAEYASKAVANYVESKVLPIMSIDSAKETVWKPVALAGGEIYLAGPFRELGQRVIIDEARKVLHGLGMKVFSPVHDIGRGPAESVVQQDLAAIERCDAVLAILNGSSPGTVFEVGYAVAKNKFVCCVAQNMRDNDLKLPVGAGCIVEEDFISALHQIAWRQ